MEADEKLMHAAHLRSVRGCFIGIKRRLVRSLGVRQVKERGRSHG
jgi:hypothetical protein